MNFRHIQLNALFDINAHEPFNQHAIVTHIDAYVKCNISIINCKFHQSLKWRWIPKLTFNMNFRHLKLHALCDINAHRNASLILTQIALIDNIKKALIKCNISLINCKFNQSFKWLWNPKLTFNINFRHIKLHAVCDINAHLPFQHQNAIITHIDAKWHYSIISKRHSSNATFQLSFAKCT